MKVRELLRFLMILVLAFQAAGQAGQSDPMAAWERVRTSLEAREPAKARAELELIRQSYRQFFDVNNLDYLTARLNESLGDQAAAIADFERVAARGSVLKPYALLHLAKIASVSGNLIVERMYLQEILTLFPDSLPASPARERLARSLFESGDYDGAIRRITTPAASTDLRTDPRARETLVFVGESLLRAGKLAEAREAFLKLVNTQPNPAQPDDFALAGAIGLDRLDAGDQFGKSAPQLADFLHLQRAMIYQFNRDFADARLHYQAIIERYPESPNVPDAMFQIGRGYAQTRNFAEAREWFDKLIAKFPDSPSAKDAIPQSAAATARLGDAKAAVERYRTFIEKYPDDERLDRAYLNIIDVLRDSNDDKGALEWAARTQNDFRGRPPEAIALFAQLRIRIAAADWTNALVDADRLLAFSDLGGTRVPGGTTQTEISFMRATALEGLGRFAEAIEAYLAIPDGRSEYYGWLATERLRSMTRTESAKPFIDNKSAELKRTVAEPPNGANAEAFRRAAQSLYRINADPALLSSIRAAYDQLESYRRVPAFNRLEIGRTKPLAPDAKETRTVSAELVFLRLFDEAAPEMERELKQRGTPIEGDTAFTLAELYLRGDMAHRAIGFIEPYWRKMPADFQIELIPAVQAEMLYPAPYAASLLKHSPPRGVDPLFLLSIMRQESRFRADIKSAAAARGLMQFIATTSNQIASELGRKNFRQDDLYDPSTAILFGSQYVANIFRQFPGKPEAVAAGYNGGEDNMVRWLARSRSDRPERYVPEIIFSQSKDYAWKVLANHRVYRIFYDDQLRFRPAFTGK